MLRSGNFLGSAKGIKINIHGVLYAIWRCGSKLKETHPASAGCISFKAYFNYRALRQGEGLFGYFY
jgi:hypothetical protein